MPDASRPPLLSAEWLNARANNIYRRALEITDNILADLTYSGYLPLELSPDTLGEMVAEGDLNAVGFDVEHPSPNDTGFVPPPVPLPTSGPVA